MTAETEFDFFNARRKSVFNELMHALHKDEVKLISFNKLKDVLKPSGQTYVGMKEIPIDKIVGSEGRYRDFDNLFLPKNSATKERWESVDDALIKDVTLPPIMVYELAGLYFVRDGNHRVSVARSRGVAFIDAEVVSLQTEIKFPKAAPMAELLKLIIAWEKRAFYAETAFGDITDDWEVNFSETGQYDILFQHILTHKYYMNEKKKEEVPLSEAVKSFYETVYKPVLEIIDNNKLMKNVRRHTKADMYLWVMKNYNKFGQ